MLPSGSGETMPNVELLSVRVLKGFLFHATEETIRTQLRSEGIDDATIATAIEKGRGTYQRLIGTAR